MAARDGNVEHDMGTIRVESDYASEMLQVYAWLIKHRNQVVALDPERNLTLGAPISGARAIIIAAVLNNGVGGVLRVLSNLTGPPVRLVFDIRSRGGLDADEVRAAGANALDSISRQIAEEALISKVA